MISKININAFKSINNLEVKCKKINLFTGTNSSGKSSTIQGILLMSQNLEYNCGLNGPLVTIGNYREARNFNILSGEIDISVEDKVDKLSLHFFENRKVEILGDLEGDLAISLDYSKGHVHYLSCNRIGSQDIYNKKLYNFENTGINGEFCIEFLCKNRDEPLDKEIISYEESYTLLSQVNYWLKYIVGATVKPEEILGTDVVKASYGIVDGIYSRPKNVGSGISYLISIIITCLGSRKGDIILIENPEIHLHPSSQSKVAEFLYFVANAGRQLFVETHSDHIFNSVRVGITNGKIKMEDVAIQFFKLGSDNCTRNYEIEVGKSGKIENPIPGLFDQFQMDYNKMLGV